MTCMRLSSSLLVAAFASLVASSVGCSGSGSVLQLSSALAFNTLTTTPSAPQTAVLTNLGPGTVHVDSIAITGSNASSFAQTSSCVGDIKPGGTCPITVTFSSSTAGTQSAELDVHDNAAFGGVQSVPLTGTAAVPAPVLTLSSSSVNFATQSAGSASAARTVTLTNTGTAPLLLSSVALSGGGANLFTESSTCPGTIPVGASCSILAVFSPLVAGSYAASISVASNASGSPQAVALSGIATPAALSIDTTNPLDWKISNGTLSLDWNSTKGNIFAMYLAGHPDNLVDVTNVSGGQPKGFYMDNSGLGTGTVTATYVNAGTYLDWSITTASGAANAYTYTEHFILTPNDAGFHTYITLNHAASDIAGSVGQVQWVFRDNLTQYTNTYAVDPSLNSPGVIKTPLPDSSQMFSTDPGRAVQDATVDLHGFTYPAGFPKSFYTKYDFAGYEYLHKAHGLYGSTYGAWTVLPSTETLVAGPTKQNLDFTGNLLMIEAYSNHEENGLTLATPAGTASSRLFGPFYVRMNAFGRAYNATGNTLATPDDLYADALQAGNSFGALYDSEAQLLASGYIPSNARGKVTVQVNGVTGAAKTAWAVLSDPGKNHQLSSAGYQYWADISASGAATFNGVAPGTYRLSVYVLGQWGELRQDGIVVTANNTTNIPVQTFVPENFSTGAPVFTIGTADRSAHEFLHGHDAKGFDDREYWGAWNYWADFASTQGAVVYNATSGPAGPATNDLSRWNYVHWGTFNPGLFGGVYNAADDTTDGYKYVIPAYVASLPGATGTNATNTRLPNWQVHFATPAAQGGSSPQKFVTLSVATACVEGSYVVTLNGKQLVWSRSNISDCMIRSGLSGTTQWFVFQWDSTILNPAGQDNLLAIGTSQVDGVSEDALRLELTNSSADPAVTKWHDYEFLYNTQDTKPNDAVANP